MILVTTAGKVGAEAARLLREQDTLVRVLVRDPGKMAAKAGVRAVVMTHLGPSVDPNDNYQRYVDEFIRWAAAGVKNGPKGLQAANVTRI